MDSSESRRLVISEEELAARPTLKFITRLSEIITTYAKTTKDIAINNENTDKAKEVKAKIAIITKAILDMDKKFLEYEKTHTPHVDIRYKNKVKEKRERARDLEESMKSVPSEHERKASELEDRIKDLREDKRDLGRGRLVAEVTDINIHTADVVDANVLQKQKKAIDKKIKNLKKCLCTDAKEAKLERYQEMLVEINQKIATAAAEVESDKGRNRENRLSKEEKIKGIDNDIAELKRQRSQHIATPIVQRIDEVEEALSSAAESYERAKADLEEAKHRALKDIGRAQLADLLLLLAQFLEFKQSVDNLYLTKRDTLKASTGTPRDQLDSLMKKISVFQTKIATDQAKIEKTFFKFTCSESAARTGKAIYRAYLALDESLKNEFARNSFVDTAILDKIIEPVSLSRSRTPELLPRLSNHPNTLHSSHSSRSAHSTPSVHSRRKHKKTETSALNHSSSNH